MSQDKAAICDRIRNHLCTSLRGLTIMGLINHYAVHVPQEVASFCHVWEGWERRFIVYRSQTQTLDFSSPPDDTFDIPCLFTARVNTNDVFTIQR